ncbi:MAG: hypothetical protein MPJ50_04030 [Pirellulales bacterium]|nr:hypothetical protein [Pirellulales bacterium]
MTLPECPEEEIIPDCPESTNLRHHRLRAPAEDGGALVSPPYSCVAPLLAANQSQRHTTDCDLLGRSLVELSSAARHEVIDAAVQYTSSYRCVPCGRKQNTEAVDEPPKIIAAGHQPELFHAGVWFKNFVLADLARIHQAVALNLVIDTDDAKPPWINVPGGSLERPLLKQISFDDPVAMVMPFEERTILNQERFAQFSEAVRHHLQPLESEPLLDQFWPVAVERAQATNNLGAALAQSRHILEESLGLVSLELPQSQVCETDSFRGFVGHVFCEAARLAEA